MIRTQWISVLLLLQQITYHKALMAYHNISVYRSVQDFIPTGVSCREFIFLSFPASRGHLHSLAPGPFQSQQCIIFSLTPCFPFIRTFVVAPNLCRSSRIISQSQNPFLITFPKFFLPCKLTYSEVPRIRMWKSLRGCILSITDDRVGM